MAVLVGCCNSAKEKYAMGVQADNGCRRLYWESKDYRVGRDSPKETWHLVWAYY